MAGKEGSDHRERAEHARFAELSWLAGQVATALVPDAECLIPVGTKVQPGRGFGIIFGGGTASGKTDAAKLLVASVDDFPNPARKGKIVVSQSGVAFRAYGYAAKIAYESALAMQERAWVSKDRLQEAHEVAVASTPEKWISYWGDNLYRLGPIVWEHGEKTPEIESDKIGDWAALITKHPYAFEQAEMLAIYDIAYKIKHQSLVIVEGPRNFQLGRQRLQRAKSLSIGNILFVADPVTAAEVSSDSLEEAISRVHTRTKIDKQVQNFPMISPEDIPRDKLIMLDEILENQQVTAKLQTAAANHGLTAEESADGWALPLVNAGIKAAADPDAVIVVQKEIFKDKQAILPWALRAIIHGMIGAANRYQVLPNNKGLATPQYLLNPE